MSTSVDARGLSCPQPVILATQAMKAGQFPIEVTVDTVTARENVRRAATNAGLRVYVAEKGDEFTLTIDK
jgi:TusA-related sulfurtransferase